MNAGCDGMRFMGMVVRYGRWDMCNDNVLCVEYVSQGDVAWEGVMCSVVCVSVGWEAVVRVVQGGVVCVV